MVSKQGRLESFNEFKKSFSYGSRSDLNFKFLSHLSDEDAADFFQTLLKEIGHCLDEGNWDHIVDHLQKWQVRGYAHEAKPVYETGPFTPLNKPLAECRLGLLTSSGHFVKGDDPNPFGVVNMTQAEAEKRISEFLKIAPQLSALPFDTPREKLEVRQGGYDINGARMDPNVVLPLDRLRELHQDGVVGKLTDAAYSFVGACSQRRLLKKSGPEWVVRLKEEAADAVLLVPV
jgi:Glycine/sarcosine/betaine reductase selenoprotein B (GRDB)